MTDSKHPPGEWFARKTRSGSIEVRKWTDKRLMGVQLDDMVCMMPHGPQSPQYWQDACLIAAAPDMLEALRGLLETSPPPKGVRLDYSYLLYREAARTAIAKATGRDQMDL
jgi:hypothetical protein